MAIAPVSFALGPIDPDRFARELGESFERFGFAVIADHGLDQGVIDRALVSSKAFFALPEAVKRRYFVEGGAGQRGYTPFGVEIAKGHEHVDLKEFWHVGRELPAGHPASAVMPANLWPSEIESFKADVYGLFQALDAMGATMLAAIARHLGEAEDFFVDPVRDGNSILRLLHYPPMPANTGGRIRAGAHEDINVITLLLGAEEAGLQVKPLGESEWIDVAPPPGALVCNVGDMLQRLTAGRLPSTSHRVINPAPERASFSRFSTPFFLHFRPDYLITPLSSCVTPERPGEAPITADDYLKERLAEIGLM